MPRRNRPAADFYYTSANCFDIVSNKVPASSKSNNNQNIYCGNESQSCDINLDDLKDFMDNRIEEIKGTLVLSNAPIQLIETLYSDVINSYNEEGPYSLPPIETITDLYTAFNDIIENTSGCIDTRLLVYRDILQMTSSVKDIHIEKIIAENRVDKLVQDNKLLGEQLASLKNALDLCQGDGDSYEFAGQLMIAMIKPKPMIYVQAIFNLKLAWYYYLYGTTMKPREYAATVEYVNCLGTKQEAYDKLIVLLDEKYRDENEEFAKLLKGTGDTSTDTSSGNTPGISSSEVEISSNSSNCQIGGSDSSNVALTCDYEPSDSDSDFDYSSDSDCECSN